MLVIYNSTNRSYLSLNIVISCIHTIYLSLSLYIYIYIYIYISFLIRRRDGRASADAAKPRTMSPDLLIIIKARGFIMIIVKAGIIINPAGLYD